MNKTIASAVVAALATLGTLATTAAHADGHYVPGVEGMQAASVPPPGFYYLGYLVDYNIDSFRAPGSSDNLPGRNKGTVVALALWSVALGWTHFGCSVALAGMALLALAWRRRHARRGRRALARRATFCPMVPAPTTPTLVTLRASALSGAPAGRFARFCTRSNA